MTCICCRGEDSQWGAQTQEQPRSHRSCLPPTQRNGSSWNKKPRTHRSLGNPDQALQNSDGRAGGIPLSALSGAPNLVPEQLTIGPGSQIFAAPSWPRPAKAGSSGPPGCTADPKAPITTGALSCRPRGLSPPHCCPPRRHQRNLGAPCPQLSHQPALPAPGHKAARLSWATRSPSSSHLRPRGNRSCTSTSGCLG